jgi:hypothetical protein
LLFALSHQDINMGDSNRDPQTQAEKELSMLHHLSDTDGVANQPQALHVGSKFTRLTDGFLGSQEFSDDSPSVSDGRNRCLLFLITIKF